jgi:hypothetical protein
MPNPLSYVLHNGTGAQTSFSFAGIDDYLSVTYIKVYLNDVLQTTGYTIDAANELVNFSPTAPASGVIVKIARETPTTSAGFTGNVVDFSNGSVLTAEDLDKGFKGLLHIVQEANDTGSGALGKTTDQLGWNAAALPVKNAGYAIDPTDLVTKAQMDAISLYGASTIPQSWSFTGTGSQLSFTLSPLPSSTAADMFIVEVGGVLQRPVDDYSITTNALVFVAGSAPGSGIGIRVRNFGVARNALDVVPSSSITNAYMAANSISTSNIQDDAVTAAKLADNSVFTAALQNDAVTQEKIADNAVGNDQLTVNSVSTDKLTTSAVTTPKIANNAITSEKIANAAVDTAALGLNAVTLTNMKGVNFTSGLGIERLLHISTAGELTAKTLNTIGFGGAVSANLDFGNGPYKCVNLGAPNANGDAIRYDEVLSPGQLVNGYKLLNQHSLPRFAVAMGYIDDEIPPSFFTTAPAVFSRPSNSLVLNSNVGTWYVFRILKDAQGNTNFQGMSVFASSTTTTTTLFSFLPGSLFIAVRSV